jgi:flagellar export protein FliJ
MKKFIYSLEGVLRVRRLQEQQTRAELAKVIAEREVLFKEVEALKSEILDCKKRLPTGVINIADYQLNETYQKGLNVKIQNLSSKLARFDLKIENVKLDLRKRILETRKLETHHDNEKVLWREESLKVEQAEFDDNANSKLK